MIVILFFFFQAEDGIRDRNVTGVQTCALPILIPTNRISPQAANLLKLLPAPTLTNVTGGANNFIGSGVQDYDTNEPGIRVDYVQNSKLRYFGHYAYGGYHLNTPGAFKTAGGPQFNGLSGEGITDARNQN